MSEEKDFQSRVAEWMMACFSMEFCRDTTERNHRFLEEALELVQSLGCTQSEAHQLVDYVFQRPAGDSRQEIGGVMLSVAALCLANEFNMNEAGEAELRRVWSNIEVIRAKQAAKPKHSPLPQASAPPTPAPHPQGDAKAIVPTKEEREQYRSYARLNLSSSELAMVARLLAALEHVEGERDAIRTEMDLAQSELRQIFEMCQSLGIAPMAAPNSMSRAHAAEMVRRLGFSRDALREGNARLKARNEYLEGHWNQELER